MGKKYLFHYTTHTHNTNNFITTKKQQLFTERNFLFYYFELFMNC